LNESGNECKLEYNVCNGPSGWSLAIDDAPAMESSLFMEIGSFFYDRMRCNGIV